MPAPHMVRHGPACRGRAARALWPAAILFASPSLPRRARRRRGDSACRRPSTARCPRPVATIANMRYWIRHQVRPYPAADGVPAGRLGAPFVPNRARRVPCPAIALLPAFAPPPPTLPPAHTGEPGRRPGPPSCRASSLLAARGALAGAVRGAPGGAGRHHGRCTGSLPVRRIRTVIPGLATASGLAAARRDHSIPIMTRRISNGLRFRYGLPDQGHDTNHRRAQPTNGARQV